MNKSRLLSVAQARAEVTAGVPGQCSVSIRVLDDVTLRIHAGELLLVQTLETLGQSMLLAALAGRADAPQHRYVRARRNAAPGLRIRRAALHVGAVQEILRGWQELVVEPTVPASRTLYLLRASRGGPLTLREAAEWRRWGRQSHARRDGIVIACSPMPIPLGQAHSMPKGTSMHEPTASYGIALSSRHPASSDREREIAEREIAERGRTVRILELRAGRLHNVRAPRRISPSTNPPTAGPAPLPWSGGGSGDARAPTACHPVPTASTES